MPEQDSRLPEVPTAVQEAASNGCTACRIADSLISRQNSRIRFLTAANRDLQLQVADLKDSRSRLQGRYNRLLIAAQQQGLQDLQQFGKYQTVKARQGS